MCARVRACRREAGKPVSFLSLFIPPGSCVIKSDPAGWLTVSPWHCPEGGDEGVGKYRSQSLLWHCPQPPSLLLPPSRGLTISSPPGRKQNIPPATTWPLLFSRVLISVPGRHSRDALGSTSQEETHKNSDGCSQTTAKISTPRGKNVWPVSPKRLCVPVCSLAGCGGQEPPPLTRAAPSLCHLSHCPGLSGATRRAGAQLAQSWAELGD